MFFLYYNSIVNNNKQTTLSLQLQLQFIPKDASMIKRCCAPPPIYEFEIKFCNSSFLLKTALLNLCGTVYSYLEYEWSWMNGLGSTEGKSNIIYYVRWRHMITVLMNCICTKQKYLKNGTPLTQDLCNYNTL